MRALYRHLTTAPVAAVADHLQLADRQVQLRIKDLTDGIPEGVGERLPCLHETSPAIVVSTSELSRARCDHHRPVTVPP